MSRSLGEILKTFKETESPENIVPLIEDAELRNGVVAWKSVVVKYRDSEPCDLKSESEQWEWMWTKVDFDNNLFAVVAGVQPQNGQRLFLRLKGLRLIYPDGTIHHFASQFLQSIIMSKLPKTKKTK